MTSIDEAPEHLRTALRTLEIFKGGGSFEDSEDGVTWANLQAAEEWQAVNDGR